MYVFYQYIYIYIYICMYSINRIYIYVYLYIYIYIYIMHSIDRICMYVCILSIELTLLKLQLKTLGDIYQRTSSLGQVCISFGQICCLSNDVIIKFLRLQNNFPQRNTLLYYFHILLLFHLISK